MNRDKKDGIFYDRREYDNGRNLSSRIDRRGRRFLIWTYDIRDLNYCHENEEKDDYLGIDMEKLKLLDMSDNIRSPR